MERSINNPQQGIQRNGKKEKLPSQMAWEPWKLMLFFTIEGAIIRFWERNRIMSTAATVLCTFPRAFGCGDFFVSGYLSSSPTFATQSPCGAFDPWQWKTTGESENATVGQTGGTRSKNKENRRKRLEVANPVTFQGADDQPAGKIPGGLLLRF